MVKQHFRKSKIKNYVPPLSNEIHKNLNIYRASASQHLPHFFFGITLVRFNTSQKCDTKVFVEVSGNR
jgi:hypothetical protein